MKYVDERGLKRGQRTPYKIPRKIKKSERKQIIEWLAGLDCDTRRILVWYSKRNGWNTSTERMKR